MLSENLAGSASPIAASSVLITVFALTNEKDNTDIIRDNKIVLKKLIFYILILLKKIKY